MTMEGDAGLPPSTTETHLGSQLRTAREAAGYSLARMADVTHFSKPYLGLVETGHRAATADLVHRYEQVLGVAIGTPHDPVRLAHEWLIGEPPAAAHLRAGRRIGVNLLPELERRVIELRHLDDTVTSTHLLPIIIAERDRAENLAANAVYPQRLGTRLFTVIGELSQLAGWVASDAGQYRYAQRLYLAGVSAADAAGDRPLGANLISSLAYQIANIGKREDALLLAKTAVTGAADAPPLVQAMLSERVAWAAARANDPDAAHRALDTVDDAYARHSDAIAEPEWVYWLNRDEIDVMAARCHIELGQPADAEPLLTHALAGYNQEHVREVALYRTWLAEGYAKTGNLDAARTALALATAVPTDSARLRRRIDAVTKLIDRRNRKSVG
jgi:transcriptional regulator with XRE-family HTH domain